MRMYRASEFLVFEEVVGDLKTMYLDQPTYNEDKIRIIVSKAIDEVIKARRYIEEGYSVDRIDEDLKRFKAQIYKIAEYDFSQFGAPYEQNHSENSISRTWIDRNKLFYGIIPLSHL